MNKDLMKIIVGFLVLLAIGIIVVYMVFAMPETGDSDQSIKQSTSDTNNEINSEDSNIRMYTNQEYNFTLEYPAQRWSIAENVSAAIGNPLYSVHKVVSELNTQPPFDHFTNQTHVSVYPEGIATEGVIGVTEEFDEDLSFMVDEQSRWYVLDDGQRYAAYIRPQNPPANWTPAGFIWLRLEVQDLTTQCYDAEGVELSTDECDPFIKEHVIQRKGAVNMEDMITALNIVESIQLK